MEWGRRVGGRCFIVSSVFSPLVSAPDCYRYYVGSANTVSGEKVIEQQASSAYSMDSSRFFSTYLTDSSATHGPSSIVRLSLHFNPHLVTTCQGARPPHSRQTDATQINKTIKRETWYRCLFCGGKKEATGKITKPFLHFPRPESLPAWTRHTSSVFIRVWWRENKTRSMPQLGWEQMVRFGCQIVSNIVCKLLLYVTAAFNLKPLVDIGCQS